MIKEDRKGKKTINSVSLLCAPDKCSLVSIRPVATIYKTYVHSVTKKTSKRNKVKLGNKYTHMHTKCLIDQKLLRLFSLVCVSC